MACKFTGSIISITSLLFALNNLIQILADEQLNCEKGKFEPDSSACAISFIFFSNWF